MGFSVSRTKAGVALFRRLGALNTLRRWDIAIGSGASSPRGRCGIQRGSLLLADSPADDGGGQEALELAGRAKSSLAATWSVGQRHIWQRAAEMPVRGKMERGEPVIGEYGRSSLSLRCLWLREWRRARRWREGAPRARHGHFRVAMQSQNLEWLQPAASGRHGDGRLACMESWAKEDCGRLESSGVDGYRRAEGLGVDEAPSALAISARDWRS